MKQRELCLVRGIALGVALALAGCAEQRQNREPDTYAAGDTRYDDYDSNEADEAVDESEAEQPGYVEAPTYYSALWPAYHTYYDPGYSPDFYYGVTYFPSTGFGLGLGDYYAWPYYAPYSPYYYVWYDSGHHHRRHHDHDSGHHHGDRDHPRLGTGADEAERLAHRRDDRMQRPAEGWHAGWPGRYADATPKPPTHGDENHPAPAPPASGARADPQRNASARPGEVRRGWQAAPQHDGAVTGNEAGEAVAQAPRRGRHGSDASQGGMSATPTAVAGGHRSRDQTGWIGPAPGAGAAYGEGGGEIDAAEVMVRPEAPRDGVANTAPRLDRMSRLQARGAEPAAPAPGREAFAARPIASDERTSHQPGSMRAGGYVPASNEAMPMAGYRPLAAPRDGAMQALAPQPYRLPAVPAAAPSTPRDAISPGRESSGGDDRVRGSERERK